jgi:enoyl-CoA hydratase
MKDGHAAEHDSLVKTDRRGRVTTITINRAQKRNALSNDVIAALRAAVAQVRVDSDARVLVLRGAGNRAFCAGGDLSEMMAPKDHLIAHHGRGELAALFQDLWSLGKPTIARVAGHALAGGMGLAMACDFVLAADNAQFGVPEINVGLWGFMVTVPLMRSMAPKLALDLMLTGRILTADEALRAGMVRSVSPLTDLDAVVKGLADELAAKPPEAVRIGRQSYYAALDLPSGAALAMLHPLLTVLLGSSEAAEGLAAFAEGREPSWGD